MLSFVDIPRWFFEIKETSANIYTGTGQGPLGQAIQRQGVDPDILLDELKKEALIAIAHGGAI